MRATSALSADGRTCNINLRSQEMLPMSVLNLIRTVRGTGSCTHKQSQQLSVSSSCLQCSWRSSRVCRLAICGLCLHPWRSPFRNHSVRVCCWLRCGGSLGADCLDGGVFRTAVFLARLASLFLGVWCLAFGVVGSLGYVSTAREASNSERLAALDARQQARRFGRRRRRRASPDQRRGKSTQWRAARANGTAGRHG